MVWKIATLLLQLRVLGFGFFQDEDVGVGVFPEGEEVLICFRSAVDVSCWFVEI